MAARGPVGVGRQKARGRLWTGRACGRTKREGHGIRARAVWLDQKGRGPVGQTKGAGEAVDRPRAGVQRGKGAGGVGRQKEWERRRRAGGRGAK